MRGLLDYNDLAMIFKGHCIEWLGVTGIGLIVDYSALHAYNALLVCDKSEAPRMVMFEAQTDRVLESPNGMHRDASGYLHFYLFIYPTDSFEDVALFYQYHYTDDAIVLERYDNELALRVTT